MWTKAAGAALAAPRYVLDDLRDSRRLFEAMSRMALWQRALELGSDVGNSMVLRCAGSGERTGDADPD